MKWTSILLSNYLFCSCQEDKISQDARRLNRLKEHLSGGIYGCFNGFFWNHSSKNTLKLATYFIYLQNTLRYNQEGKINCRTHPRFQEAKHRENTWMLFNIILSSRVLQFPANLFSRLACLPS